MFPVQVFVVEFRELIEVRAVVELVVLDGGVLERRLIGVLLVQRLDELTFLLG
jgi:hypothetical protein